MPRYLLPVRGYIFILTALILNAGISGADAQELPLPNVLHVYNSTCGPINLVILNEDEECPQGLETCRLTIKDGARADVNLTGALPAALTYQVEGQCLDDWPTLISGRCEATLVRLTPKHPGADTSSLESAMESPCPLSGDSCAEIKGGSIRNKMVTQQHRTIDIELGLCDQGQDGLDRCQVQCKVR